MQTPAFQNHFMTIKETSAYLGGTPIPTIRQWVTQRRLTSYKAGKARLFKKEDIDAFMAQYVRKSVNQLTQEIAQQQLKLKD